MELKGNILFFVSVRSGKRFFEGSIAKKNKDGSYSHARIDLEFGKENFPLEKLNALKENTCYSLDVDEGFLTCNCYTNKEGKAISKVVIHVSKGNLVKSKPVEAKKTPKGDDLPF